MTIVEIFLSFIFLLSPYSRQKASLGSNQSWSDRDALTSPNMAFVRFTLSLLWEKGVKWEMKEVKVVLSALHSYIYSTDGEERVDGVQLLLSFVRYTQCTTTGRSRTSYYDSTKSMDEEAGEEAGKKVLKFAWVLEEVMSMYQPWLFTLLLNAQTRRMKLTCALMDVICVCDRMQRKCNRRKRRKKIIRKNSSTKNTDGTNFDTGVGTNTDTTIDQQLLLLCSSTAIHALDIQTLDIMDGHFFGESKTMSDEKILTELKNTCAVSKQEDVFDSFSGSFSTTSCYQSMLYINDLLDALTYYTYNTSTVNKENSSKNSILEENLWQYFPTVQVHLLTKAGKLSITHLIEITTDCTKSILTIAYPFVASMSVQFHQAAAPLKEKTQILTDNKEHEEHEKKKQEAKQDKDNGREDTLSDKSDGIEEDLNDVAMDTLYTTDTTDTAGTTGTTDTTSIIENCDCEYGYFTRDKKGQDVILTVKRRSMTTEDATNQKHKDHHYVILGSLSYFHYPCYGRHVINPTSLHPLLALSPSNASLCSTRTTTSVQHSSIARRTARYNQSAPKPGTWMTATSLLRVCANSRMPTELAKEQVFGFVCRVEHLDDLIFSNQRSRRSAGWCMHVGLITTKGLEGLEGLEELKASTAEEDQDKQYQNTPVGCFQGSIAVRGVDGVLFHNNRKMLPMERTLLSDATIPKFTIQDHVMLKVTHHAVNTASVNKPTLTMNLSISVNSGPFVLVLEGLSREEDMHYYPAVSVLDVHSVQSIEFIEVMKNNHHDVRKDVRKDVQKVVRKDGWWRGKKSHNNSNHNNLVLSVTPNTMTHDGALRLLRAREMNITEMNVREEKKEEKKDLFGNIFGNESEHLLKELALFTEDEDNALVRHVNSCVLLQEKMKKMTKKMQKSSNTSSSLMGFRLNLHTDEIPLSKEDLLEHRCLWKYDEKQLRIRLHLLHALNEAVYQNFSLLNVSYRCNQHRTQTRDHVENKHINNNENENRKENEGENDGKNDVNDIDATLGARLLKYRHLLYTSTKMFGWNHALSTTMTENSTQANNNPFSSPQQLRRSTNNSKIRPSIKIDRGFSASKHVKSSLKSVFTQTYQQLKNVHPLSLRQRDRAWHVNFFGEHSVDAGGPYREVISQMLSELQNVSSSMHSAQLFVPTPNARNDVGQWRDSFLPNPLYTCKHHHDLHKEDGGSNNTLAKSQNFLMTNYDEYGMYSFLGQLMGISLRTHNPMNINLPPLIWKLIIGQRPNREDLRDIDVHYIEYHDELLKLVHTKDNNNNNNNNNNSNSNSNEQQQETLFAMQYAIPWTTKNVLGHDINLFNHYHETDYVQYHDIEMYVKKCEAYRLSEFAAHCLAIQCGIATIIPYQKLSLWTWYELEKNICGNPGFDVQVLKKHTLYKNGLKMNHRLVIWLWEILDTFQIKEKQRFLRFVWGRTRLPLTEEGWRNQHFVVCLRHSSDSQNMNNTNGENENDSLVGIGAVAKRQQRENASLPEAHTCFWQLDLPSYSNREVMKERLLFAITYCSSIDTDA